MTLTRSPLLRKAPTTERKVRTKKCKVKACRKEFTQTRAIQPCCSINCEHDWIMSERARKARKERQEGLRKLKTKGDHVKEAQVAFNAYCRLRDRGQQCISCDESLWRLSGITGGNYDCGHFRSRGSAPHLRFHEDNAHGQCKRCNRYLAGNITEYRPRLIARIGLARVEALEADQTPRKWTVEQLIAIKQEYRLKLKQLKGE